MKEIQTKFNTEYKSVRIGHSKPIPLFRINKLKLPPFKR